jgi:hypothetical protein
MLAWLATIATACSSDRPELDEWSHAWSRRPMVPELSELEPSAARARCERLLTDAHDAPSRLLPTPDPGIDEAVREWILRVESLGFECSTARYEIGEFTVRREEIQLLEAEVAAAVAIAIERDSSQ